MNNPNIETQTSTEFPPELLAVIEEMRVQIYKDIQDGTVDHTTMAFQCIIDEPELLIAMVEEMVELERFNSESVD